MMDSEGKSENTQARIERERVFHNQIFSSMKRQQLTGLYSLAGSSEDNYFEEVSRRFAGADILEYGCGPHTYATMAARAGARSVLGIDISDTAIETSRSRCQVNLKDQPSLLEKVRYQRMNAEALELADGSFDMVFGTAILHHLDLDKAFSEIQRVLRPGGQGVFLEPLGHNPLINWYRDRTPDLRTPDEHPLLEKDFELLRSMFRDVRVRYYHLSTLGLVPVSKYPIASRFARYFDMLDTVMFKVMPSLRKHAWSCVIVMTK